MKAKKKAIILAVICLAILIGAIVGDKILGKNYYSEIKYNDVINKIKNKEDIILLVSQTTCGHCANYKPKLEGVANEYKIPVYFIDVDLLSDNEYDEFKKYVNYSATPVTIFLKNGEESSAATRINGDASKEKIIKKLKSNGFISE